MDELNKILNKDEEIIWKGKPKFLPYFIVHIILMIIFILLFLFMFSTDSKISSALSFFTPFAIIFLILLIVPIWQLLSYKYLYYAITNKRILVQKGLIGRDFEMIDFDKITDISVDVGLIDKLFGKSSGSVRIQTPSKFEHTRSGTIAMPTVFSHIAEPYKTFKLLKKVSYAETVEKK